MGYTSSQNSTELSDAASNVRANSPVLSSWMLQGSLGVITIWPPKNHWVLYGPSGTGPGRVSPGGLHAERSPGSDWAPALGWRKRPRRTLPCRPL